MLPVLFAASIIQTPSQADLLSWGEETLQMIRRDFYIPERRLYAESWRHERRSKQPSFNWPAGVMLSALNAAARSDPKYRPWLREYAEAVQTYWNPIGPVPGFDVLPGPKPVDRYYDDNAWMVMALVETYEILGEAKYLNRAEEALKFVLSGEDSKLRGGVYWRESDRAGKNTCSNGPAAAACMAICRYRPVARYVQGARRIYDWTRRTLRDPTDGLFWDNIGLDGRIERTKWSYNSALMLRAAVKLGRADDARELVEASKTRWLAHGTITDEGKFAHLLLEAWLLAGERQSAVARTLRLLRSNSGHFGKRWDRVPESGTDQFELIDQASAARAFFVLAQSE